MAIRARRRHVRHAQVMNHPAFVPAALVVDDEQAGDIGKNIDERANIVRIGRQTRFRLHHDANGTDRRQTAIRAGRREHRLIVYAGERLGENVRLETICTEQVVLKELARLIGFGKGLSRQRAVRPAGQPPQCSLQLAG